MSRNLKRRGDSPAATFQPPRKNPARTAKINAKNTVSSRLRSNDEMTCRKEVRPESQTRRNTGGEPAEREVPGASSAIRDSGNQRPPTLRGPTPRGTAGRSITGSRISVPIKFTGDERT